MKRFKNTKDGYITSISTGNGEIAITETEYNNLLSVIRSASVTENGKVWRLRADTLEWEESTIEAPTGEPEATTDEILDILTGVSE